MLTKEELDTLSREQLIALLLDDSKNVIAMDGVWFQAIEKEQGMNSAMHFDEEAWKVYTKAEARRIKKFLGLEEHCGLEGLAKALQYRMVDRPNPSETVINGNILTYKIKVCRVQEARTRKGMPLHPCKSAAIYEYTGFAEAIDSRIKCRCLSCFPDVTDANCSCSWEFRIDE